MFVIELKYAVQSTEMWRLGYFGMWLDLLCNLILPPYDYPKEDFQHESKMKMPKRETQIKMETTG
jgi:hypothetical protein